MVNILELVSKWLTLKSHVLIHNNPETWRRFSLDGLNKRNRCRFPYFAYADFEPSKMKLALEICLYLELE